MKSLSTNRPAHATATADADNAERVLLTVKQEDCAAETFDMTAHQAKELAGALLDAAGIKFKLHL